MTWILPRWIILSFFTAALMISPALLGDLSLVPLHLTTTLPIDFEALVENVISYRSLFGCDRRHRQDY